MPDPFMGHTAAARLLSALEGQTLLDCTQVRALLPDFVEAEAAGVDVDTQPEYAALLQHLDSCAECMALYAELSADLEYVMDAPAVPTEMLTAPPTFFKPARQTENVVLRVLGNIQRAFQLDIRVRLPNPGTLSGGQSVNFFADTLPEVNGTPIVAVALVPAADGSLPSLLVAVREPQQTGSWEIQLVTSDETRQATTDAQGLARFEAVTLAAGAQLHLSCRALPVA